MIPELKVKGKLRAMAASKAAAGRAARAGKGLRPRRGRRRRPRAKVQVMTALCNDWLMKMAGCDPATSALTSRVGWMTQTIKGQLGLTVSTTDPRIGDLMPEHFVRGWRLEIDQDGRFAGCFRGDSRHWPIATQSVDLIVFALVLEALDDPLAAIDEAERVLVDGGVLLVAEWSPRSRYRRAAAGVARSKVMGARELARKLVALGLDTMYVDHFCVGSPSLYGRARAGLIERVLPQFCDGYVLLAVKRRFGGRLVMARHRELKRVPPMMAPAHLHQRRHPL